jgi:bacillithiol synthase
MKAIGTLAGSPPDPRLLGVSSLGTGMRERANTRRAVPPWRGAFFEHWVAVESRLGAPPGAVERAREVADGRGVVVLAGQQPAMWGGPLYSLYKLLSAIETARWLEDQSGIPVLPVFWSVGDDSDFGEVSSVWFPTSTGKILKVRDETLPPGGTRIGTLSTSRQRALVESHSEAWIGHRRGAWVRAVLEEALERAETWSEAQSSIFHRLLPGAPFLLVDGGDRLLLESAQSWLRETRAHVVPDLLAEGAGVTRSLQVEPSFEPELASRALFRLDGDRREPLIEAPEPGDLLAPNVILRPCLQDWFFPNVATICGGSEIRYRAQLGPVYRALGVPEPIRLPRLHAELIPPLTPVVGSELAGYGGALEDPAAWVDARVDAALPNPLMGELQALREYLRGETVRLGERAQELDPSLQQLFDSAAGKADYQLDRLVEGIRGKTRHRVLQSEPFLAGLSDFLRPRGREQERVLSLLTPYLCEENASACLLEQAARHRRALLEKALPVEERAVLLLDGWVREGEDR